MSSAANPASQPKKNEKHLKSSNQQIPPRSEQKVILPFKTMDILSDSHGRHISRLLIDNIDSRTKITGLCKPSAKLSQIIPRQPSFPDTCRVIIGGTNDVATGNQRNLYNNLETALKQANPSSKLLVATLPLRHDLPYSHPINEETLFVNAHIVERCAKCPGVEVVDFNLIRRSHFTRHGMHLSYRGKKQLARLVLQAANKVAHSNSSLASDPPVGIVSNTSTATSQSPDTYAEAVKNHQHSTTGDSLDPLKGDPTTVGVAAEATSLKNTLLMTTPVTDAFLGLTETQKGAVTQSHNL